MSTCQKYKFNWKPESEKLLLNLIRGYRIIWDRTHDDYYKTKQRLNAYNIIAQALAEDFPELQQLNGEHVRTKFQNIRTYVLVLRQKIHQSSSSFGNRLAHKWHLLNHAKFLMDSTDNTDDATSAYVIPDAEQQSPQVKLGTAFSLSSESTSTVVDTTAKSQLTAGESLSLGVTSPPPPSCSNLPEVTQIPSLRSSKQSSSEVCIEVDPLDLNNITVNSCGERKSQRISSDISVVGSCVESLRSYKKKKKLGSVESPSMGSFVEATIDRLFRSSSDSTLTEADRSLPTKGGSKVAVCESLSSGAHDSPSPVCSSVPEASQIPSPRSSQYSSPEVTIEEDFIDLKEEPLDFSDVTVKPSAERKRKRTSNDTSDIDSCLESLRSYDGKKKLVSVEASSMGSLVEATIDKLPYDKQILFMQKLVQLIAEVNNVKSHQ